MKTELQLALSAFDPVQEPVCRDQPSSNGFRMLCYHCPFSETLPDGLFCRKYSRKIGSRLKYGLPEWKKARAAILRRDGHACGICGSSRYLHVHHTDQDPTHDDEENLITLCDCCHAWIHARHLAGAWHHVQPRSW